MADVVDDFGRVTKLKADFESLSESLRSVMGDAVEYAAGKAEESADELKGEFERLVEAMEELGEDVKDNLKSTEDFVNEVKRAAESMAKLKSQEGSSGTGSFAAGQIEQTKILSQILASHQKALGDRAANFTAGSSSLSAVGSVSAAGSLSAAVKSPKRGDPASLSEIGFKNKGTDKYPAMLSKDEYVVNSDAARRNLGFLNAINSGKIQGFSEGGLVRPKYLKTGSGGGGGSVGGGGGGLSPDLLARLDKLIRDGQRLTVDVDGIYAGDMKIDPGSEKSVLEAFAAMGGKAADKFSDDYDKNFRRRLSTWAGSIATAFTGGGDAFQTMFEGSVKDATDFRREMRNLAFEAEGITGSFRNAQAEFAKIGTDIAGTTGVNVTAFQKAYMSNARKGFKDQKAGKKVLESGLKLSTLIGSEAQATASLFADMHRELGLGAIQMERMANNMQHVARSTGVTGDELVGVMKSSDRLLKNLRDQGTLTSTAARNVTEAMANFTKAGFADEGQKVLSAMTSLEAFDSADEDTKRFLGVAAARGKVNYQDMRHGNVMQSTEQMGGVKSGIMTMMQEQSGVKGSFESVDDLLKAIDMLPEHQRKAYTQNMAGLGKSHAFAAASAKNLEQLSAGVGGALAGLDKTMKSRTATLEEKGVAAKKMDDTMRFSSMDVMAGVREAIEKTGASSLDGLAETLRSNEDPSQDNKYAAQFKEGALSLAGMAPHLSDSLKRSFGLAGSAEQMAEKIRSMDPAEQIRMASMASSENIDKAMKAAGEGNKNFSSRMQKAFANKDMAMVESISEEMAAANSKLQVNEAAGVDPIDRLEQTMNELNQTIRAFLSPLTGAILDTLGPIGLLAIQFGMMATTMSGFLGGPARMLFGGGLANAFQSLKEGTFKNFFKAYGTARSGGPFAGMSGTMGAKAAGSSQGVFASLIKGLEAQFGSGLIKTFQKALGPAVLILGGIKGAMEASEAGRTKTEGALLGAATGGAKTGSFLTGRYGDKAGAVDKTLGVVGGAAWGAMAGAAITASLGGTDFGTSILIGAIIGGVAEVVKIITEGTDILADLFAPFQAIGNWLSGILGDLWRILKSFATLNPVTIVTEVIGGIVGIISKTVYAFFAVIFGAIRMFVIGLPRLILKAFEMLWELPRMFMESIKNALAGLANNEWLGPIFETLSVAFDAVYDGFMAIWTPISQIFSGLGTVFSDLGKALFGPVEGGSILSGIMWALKQAVWGLSYVISWLLSPVIILAKVLGFVLTIIGKVIGGIVGAFQYLYKILVGDSIVPDLVFGIIKFFATLPIRIFKFLATIPYLIGKALLKVPEAIGNAFSNIGAYLSGFGTDGPFSFLMSQLGAFYSFIGGTLKNLVGMASGVFDVLYGILTLDFGKIWEGLKSFGSALISQAMNFGSFVWKLLGNSVSFFFKMIKKIPKIFLRGLKTVFYDFPSWLMGKLMDGVWAVGNFLVLTLPKIMWQAFKNSLSAVGKFVWDTLSWPFKKIGEFLVWLWESTKQKIGEAWQYIKSMFDIKAWGKWFLGLGKAIIDGLGSMFAGIPGAIYGAMHSAASAIGLGWLVEGLAGGGGAAAGVKTGFGETAEQQETTRLEDGDKMSHAIGGLAGAVASLAKGNFSEAGGKALSATKEGAASVWEGTKYAASYLNPFSYFKEGTKKIEKPGLGMLHEGEMIVPRGIVDKIAAVGDGAFGGLSSFLGGKKKEGGGGPISSLLSFVRGKMGGGGGEDAGGSVLSSLSDRIKGMGSVFKGCCPGESGEGKMQGVSDAVTEALNGADDGSFFGRIRRSFEDAEGYTEKFFKPLTIGFKRARKNGDGFFTAVTRGLKGQFMSASKGSEDGVAGRLAGSMGWLNKSIFGESEGRDTKRSILQRIKDGIFGSKTGEETKKGILEVIKNGMFGAEGAGEGLLGWFKSKMFGNKVGEGEEGPSRPGLADAAKGTAKSLWEGTKRRFEINTEDGMIGGAKKMAKKIYGGAKDRLFGEKMADGTMGPAKPGLLDKVKGKAADIYGGVKDRLFGEKMADGTMGPAKPGLLTKARSKAADIYGGAKDRLLGKSPTEAVESATKADSKAPGKLKNFKDKMKNIAAGVKEFSGTKVLAGAVNLIPSSVGLVAMAPGSLGLRMLSALDGKTTQSSLEGLGKGVSALGEGKVLMGAAAMLAVGVASIGLIPAIPILAVLGFVGPLVRKGLMALGKGLSTFGKAAANPYTWLGVLLLGALGVMMIPLAYAMSLLSPSILAFGIAIKMAFEGAGSMLRAVGESIGMILKEITMSKALALGVAAVGIGALGVAMAVFAGGSFIADWIGYFGGDGVFRKIMQFAAMASSLMVAATAVDMLGDSFKKFAANKSGGWAEWFAGSDGVIEGFKKLSKVGTPEFLATAEAMHKMADGMDKMHSIPVARPMSGDATTATTTVGGADAAAVGGSPTADVEPVHLRDITGSILRDRAGSGGGKLQSDELTRMEDVANQQVHELVQIRQGITELVSLMRPQGGSVGSSSDMGSGNTKDPRRPMHAARFGRMKFGVPGGAANRNIVNTGEV